jgi:beta-glucosidase
MASDFVSRLNLTEKSSMITGKLSLGVGGCIGNLLPIDRVGFPGLCMQDGPNGVGIADLTSVFPSGVTMGASWDKKLIYQRGVAIGKEFRSKGINVALGYVQAYVSRTHKTGRLIATDPRQDHWADTALGGETGKGSQSTRIFRALP